MAELREPHLRYLLAIYELGRNGPDVGEITLELALEIAKGFAAEYLADYSKCAQKEMPEAV